MASLKEIASATSLAEATVSRILRNRDQCSPDTRQRVLEVARKLRYRPNMLVRGIQTGRTKSVGVMLPLASEFFGRIFAGIHDELVACDHVPIVLWCHDDLAKRADAGATSDQPALAQIFRLLDRRVDGVILRPVDDAIDDAYLREVWEREVPMIAVDRELEHTHAHFVGVDDLAIGREAAHHLLQLGHRRLGHLAGPDTVMTSARRRQGFEQAAMASGASCITAVDPRFAGTGDAAIRLLDRPDRPTAIFAANDELARALFLAALQRGLRVPHDLSIVGCGNLTISQCLGDGLTTFDQHPAQIGRAAARLLLGHYAQPYESKQRTIVRHELITRGSTAAPAGS